MGGSLELGWFLVPFLAVTAVQPPPPPPSLPSATPPATGRKHRAAIRWTFRRRIGRDTTAPHLLNHWTDVILTRTALTSRARESCNTKTRCALSHLCRCRATPGVETRAAAYALYLPFASLFHSQVGRRGSYARLPSLPRSGFTPTTYTHFPTHTGLLRLLSLWFSPFSPTFHIPLPTYLLPLPSIPVFHYTHFYTLHHFAFAST